jgi:hypothetical protein
LACDSGHANYAAVNAFLAARGINDSNIQCLGGFPALGPTIAFTGLGLTSTYGGFSVPYTAQGSIGFAGQQLTSGYGVLGVSASAAGESSVAFTGQELVSAYGGMTVAIQGDGVAAFTGLEMTSSYGGLTVSIHQDGAVSFSGLAVTSAYGTMGVTAEGGLPTVSDNFNRADGGLGSNWTIPTHAQVYAPVISSNKAVGAGAIGGNYHANAYWSADVFVADQWAQAMVPVDNMNEQGGGPAVRCATGSPAQYRATYIRWDDGEGDSGQVVSLEAVLSNGNKAFLAEYGFSGTNPIIKISASGAAPTVLKVYVNGVEGISFNYSTYNLTGNPGVGFSRATYGVDNWSAGDL